MKKINDLRLVSENELEMVVGGGSITKVVKGTMESIAVGILATAVSAEAKNVIDDVLLDDGGLQTARTNRKTFLTTLKDRVSNQRAVGIMQKVGGRALGCHDRIVDFIRVSPKSGAPVALLTYEH